jgi:DNA polymerase-3 subunit alpha
MNFTNLHVHSLYSWDSLSKIDDIVKFVKDDGQTAVAITDHGNMSNCVDLHRSCQAHGIKPIYGIEFYICQDGGSADDKTADNRKLDHLVVLAKNRTGFENICKLTEYAANNFYYYPRIDEKTLFAHSDGLIVICGHLGTALANIIFYNNEGVSMCETLECADQYLLPTYKEEFQDICKRYHSVFGDDFYVECQLFDQDDMLQQALGYTLYNLAKEYGYKAVGTGDAHYIRKEDSPVHKTFVAIKQNTQVKYLDDIPYFTSGKYGLITNEVAQKCYPQDLVAATQEILSKIEDYNIVADPAIPKFSNDDNETLRRLCYEVLENEFNNDPIYKERLEKELSLICSSNLSGYFLIVQDYVKWAIDQGMLIGPARGSGGGCLTGYFLGITSLDPIKYNLLFERFYSEDRAKAKQLPDYDVDFPTSRRDEVIQYITDKYGEDKVCQAITFGKLGARGALKDVLRVYQVCDFTTINKISALIPAKDKISDKLEEFSKREGTDSLLVYTLMEEPELLQDYCRIEKNEEGQNILVGDWAKYFDLAIKIEGAIKSISTHPSAVIISDKPITASAPIARDQNKGKNNCALDMYSFEDVSLVKFDILALKNLDCLMELNNILQFNDN